MVEVKKKSQTKVEYYFIKGLNYYYYYNINTLWVLHNIMYILSTNW